MKPITEFLVNNRVQNNISPAFVKQHINDNCGTLKEGDYVRIMRYNRGTSHWRNDLFGKLRQTPNGENDPLKFLYMITYSEEIVYFTESGTLNDFDSAQFAKLTDEEINICVELEKYYVNTIQDKYSPKSGYFLNVGKLDKGELVYSTPKEQLED